ncbi:MAG: hypothetical protein AAGJ32_12505 [Pseudomonadota bacterium]
MTDPRRAPVRAWYIATPTLATAATLTVTLHIAIHWTRHHAGVHLLDFQLTGDSARALLTDLANVPGATDTHFWITAALDTPYALAYGALVAGLCARYAPSRPALYAAAAFLGAACDLAENALHILALTGTADLLSLKPLFTPTKFALIAPASALATWLWARSVFGRA